MAYTNTAESRLENSAQVSSLSLSLATIHSSFLRMLISFSNVISFDHVPTQTIYSIQFDKIFIFTPILQVFLGPLLYIFYDRNLPICRNKLDSPPCQAFPTSAPLYGKLVAFPQTLA